MKITLECPYGKYDEKMKIQCTKANGRCAHIRFRPCLGREIQTENARDCPARKEK